MIHAIQKLHFMLGHFIFMKIILIYCVLMSYLYNVQAQPGNLCLNGNRIKRENYLLPYLTCILKMYCACMIKKTNKQTQIHKW